MSTSWSLRSFIARCVPPSAIRDDAVFLDPKFAYPLMTTLGLGLTFGLGMRVGMGMGMVMVMGLELGIRIEVGI